LVASGVNTLSPEQEKKWEAITQPVVADWAHKAPEGEKILKAFQDGIKEYRSGKAAAK
jgi:TRAP-type C4-dicarboxylate transport system substrate-binding protein